MPRQGPALQARGKTTSCTMPISLLLCPRPLNTRQNGSPLVFQTSFPQTLETKGSAVLASRLPSYDKAKPTGISRPLPSELICFEVEVGRRDDGHRSHLRDS